MLLNLHKKSWMEGLTLQDYSEHCKLNETIVKEMLELAKNYNKVQFRWLQALCCISVVENSLDVRRSRIYFVQAMQSFTCIQVCRLSGS